MWQVTVATRLIDAAVKTWTSEKSGPFMKNLWFQLGENSDDAPDPSESDLALQLEGMITDGDLLEQSVAAALGWVELYVRSTDRQWDDKAFQLLRGAIRIVRNEFGDDLLS